MRLGRIGYINCYPVYGAIDRGVVALAAELVTGTPVELNDLLVAGELDVSVISAVEYARHARDLVLLPELAISCDGPVRSVALFSRRPVGQLDGRTVLLTASSRTAVALLELLCRDVWNVRPRFAQARAEGPDLDALGRLPHDAVLVIGDAALLLAARPGRQRGEGAAGSRGIAGVARLGTRAPGPPRRGRRPLLRPASCDVPRIFRRARLRSR